MKTAVYVRVSTEKQSCEMQLQAIKQFLQLKGITNVQVYQDVGESGSKESRPAFNTLLNDIKQGKVETLCIYKLDRLFRSLSHLLEYIKLFGKHGVKFISVQENIDLTTPQGMLMVHMLGAFAEFERSIIIERTKSGVATARQRGKKLGAPITIPIEVKTKVLELRQNGLSYRQIGLECGMATSKAYTIVQENQGDIK